MKKEEMPKHLLDAAPSEYQKTCNSFRSLTQPLLDSVPYIPDASTIRFCMESILALRANRIDKITIQENDFPPVFDEIANLEVSYHVKGQPSNCFRSWSVELLVFNFLTDKHRYPFQIFTREDFVHYFVDHINKTTKI